MEKKGDIVLKNVLGMVIAVIGIGMLILGIVNVYKAISNQEIKSAESRIEVLVSQIDNLNEGQQGTFSITGYRNSKEWFLLGWSNLASGKPDKCFDKSCICLCKGTTGDICQVSGEGVCRTLDEEEVDVFTEPFFYKLVIQGGAQLSGNMHRSCIRLQNNLIEVTASKADGFVEIAGQDNDEDLDKPNLNSCKPPREGDTVK